MVCSEVWSVVASFPGLSKKIWSVGPQCGVWSVGPQCRVIDGQIFHCRNSLSLQWSQLSEDERETQEQVCVSTSPTSVWVCPPHQRLCGCVCVSTSPTSVWVCVCPPHRRLCGCVCVHLTNVCVGVCVCPPHRRLCGCVCVHLADVCVGVCVSTSPTSVWVCVCPPHRRLCGCVCVSTSPTSVCVCVCVSTSPTSVWVCLMTGGPPLPPPPPLPPQLADSTLSDSAVGEELSDHDDTLTDQVALDS